jgi:hypothetical protein
MGVVKPLRGVKTKLVGLSIMLTVNVGHTVHDPPDGKPRNPPFAVFASKENI